MENDQAARLRAMVRNARAIEAAGEGPRRLAIVSLEGMAPQSDLAQFAADLVAAAQCAGVRLQPEGADTTEADWVYTLVAAPAARVDGLLQDFLVVVALAETTPSSVLATYAMIKRMHGQGRLPSVEVVFADEKEEAHRASQGLRGTCQRFLGWDAAGSSHWLQEGGAESLKGLAQQLAQQVAVAETDNSPARNSLAEVPLEPV